MRRWSTKPATPSVARNGIALVTLADWPETDFTLAADLRRIKSALLYTDTVRVYSYVPTLIENLRAADGHPELLLDFMAQLPDEVFEHLGVKDAASAAQQAASKEEFRRAKKKAYEAAAGRAQRGRLTDAYFYLSSIGWNAREVVKEAQPNADSIESLIEAGHVVVDSSGLGLSGVGDEDPEQYSSALGEMLERSDLDPLLDENSAAVMYDLAQSDLLRVGEATESAALRAFIGTGFITKLPVFPDADLPKILAAREELLGSMTRFRAAVADLAANFASGFADGADLDREMGRAFEVVNAELNGLVDDLKSTALVKEALKNIPNHPKASALGFGGWIATVTGGSQLEVFSDKAAAGALASLLGAGVVGTGAALALVKQRLDARARLTGNGFHYMLRLQDRLP